MNIREARNARWLGFLDWFAHKVRPAGWYGAEGGGDWNYKSKGIEYEDFGNFNYGATGRALGLPEQVLFRAAGAVQMATRTSSPEFNRPWSKWPYGDDFKDATWTRLGIEYYNNGCWKR
jgi:hypothetical protein